MTSGSQGPTYWADTEKSSWVGSARGVPSRVVTSSVLLTMSEEPAPEMMAKDVRAKTRVMMMTAATRDLRLEMLRVDPTRDAACRRCYNEPRKKTSDADLRKSLEKSQISGHARAIGVSEADVLAWAGAGDCSVRNGRPSWSSARTTVFRKPSLPGTTGSAGRPSTSTCVTPSWSETAPLPAPSLCRSPRGRSLMEGRLSASKRAGKGDKTPREVLVPWLWMKASLWANAKLSPC